MRGARLARWVLLGALAVAAPSAEAGSSPDPAVLARGLEAYRCARADPAVQVTQPYLTLVDFSRPSSQERLWVVDPSTGEVLLSALVAHGGGERHQNGDVATDFGNVAGSHRSSLGLYTTGRRYSGEHGASLELFGWEPGVNDNAEARAIVMHGAWYVSRDMIVEHGRLGRSHGCFVLEPALATALFSPGERPAEIPHLEGGSVVWAYYPDQAWLDSSRFLGCAAASPGPASGTPKAAPEALGRAPRTGLRGTWLAGRWLHEQPQSAVDTLATQLWKLGIDVVYPNLDHGPTAPIPGTGGRAGWVHDPYAGRAFVAALHAQVPGLQVVPYKGWHDCEGLEGADWEAWIEERVEGFDASMTALGADGVQLDMECGNIDKPAVAPRFEAFLARLEARIGPDRVLSVAVPMLSQTAADYTEDRFKQAAWYGQQVSGDHPRDPRWTLTPATWERIFRHADQVVVMAYDTWYTPAQSASYQRMVAGQAWVGADFARSFRKEFLVGLRFSTADSPRKGMHYHSVENPTVGLGALAVLTAPDHPAAPLLERWLAGVSYYRLDATLEASYDARIGAPYLASVRGW